MKTCTQPDCERLFYAKGLCQAHYRRLWKGKDLSTPINVVNDDVTRFFTHVNKTDKCWVWTGSRRGKNQEYGKFWMKGTGGVSPHRFSYELFKGTIKPGMQIDHICENKLCVNPEHLEQVTNRENQIRRWKR